MEHSDPTHPSCESPLPERLLSRLAGLPRLFTRPTWQNVLLLVAGAILAPGKRTVTAALRILGREQENDFPIYHGVLNRAVWSSRAVAGWLLRLLVGTFVGADATVVIGIDDTIERRWGHKISARGIYRDPVRPSKGHFVKTSGLRWLSAQLLVHIPWAEVAKVPSTESMESHRRAAASWGCRFSPCSHHPSASTPGNPARPRRCWIGLARLLCRSIAGCRAAGLSSSATPRSPPSNSSAPSDIMSVSSPGCGSTPIFMPPHHPNVRAADDRRLRASACPL
jgi:hypothetical protein